MSTTSSFSKTFEFQIRHPRHPTQSKTLTTEQKDDFFLDLQDYYQNKYEFDTVLENNIL